MKPYKPLEVPRRMAPPVRGADLKRNTLTLGEHRRRLEMLKGKYSPLTPEEEERIHPGDNGYV